MYWSLPFLLLQNYIDLQQEKELAEHLNELFEFELSDADLANPKQSLVVEVFEAFLEMLMVISKEELNQPTFAGLKALSYRELHEESVPKLTLFRKT